MPILPRKPWKKPWMTIHVMATATGTAIAALSSGCQVSSCMRRIGQNWKM
jgi:hypothetical protein